MNDAAMIDDGACKRTVLIVDDDPNVLEVLGARLSSAGYRTLKATRGFDALRHIERDAVDVMISDVKMPHMGGEELFKEARSLCPHLPVVFLTAYGTIPDAVSAVKSGAADYLEKPFDGRELVRLIERVAGGSPGDSDTETPAVEDGIFFRTRSPVMKALYGQVEKVAGSDVNVLILGQSGVGKERIAQMLHRLSPRQGGPMVVVDCGATPSNLLESELFGHVRGAFTDAIRDRKGLIESADGGTLFLDEVGNISPEMQVRLLRFLEDRKIRKVGSLKEQMVDCRIIAATNANLRTDMEAGRFREDLYYRLRVVALEVPRLKDRREDIPSLAGHFVRAFCARHKLPPLRVQPDAVHRLSQYAWPGNVREMKNVLEAAVVFSKNGRLTAEDLVFPDGCDGPGLPPEAMPESDGFSLEENERNAILRALQKTGGVQKKAAELLGISRRAIHYKIKKHAIRV